MKKIGFIVQFLCLALFSFGQSAEEGINIFLWIVIPLGAVHVKP